MSAEVNDQPPPATSTTKTATRRPWWSIAVPVAIFIGAYVAFLAATQGSGFEAKPARGPAGIVIPDDSFLSDPSNRLMVLVVGLGLLLVAQQLFWTSFTDESQAAAAAETAAAQAVAAVDLPIDQAIAVGEIVEGALAERDKAAKKRSSRNQRVSVAIGAVISIPVGLFVNYISQVMQSHS